jgi:hypothetical protein
MDFSRRIELIYSFPNAFALAHVTDKLSNVKANAYEFKISIPIIKPSWIDIKLNHKGFIIVTPQLTKVSHCAPL